MRNWNIVNPDRREAVIAFRNFMQKQENAAIRQRCCDDPNEAKKQFAIKGEFYLQDVDLPGQPSKPGNVADIQIPGTVQFKVYDSEDKKRHDLVVLILPSSHGVMSTEPTDIWIAAWPAWGSVETEIAQLVARLNMLGQQLAAEQRGP